MEYRKNSSKTSNRKSFLLTLVTSVLILICLPIIVFQIFLVNQSKTEILHSNTEFYRSALLSCANSYHEQVDLLRYSALNVGLDPSLAVPLRSDSTPYDVGVAARTLEAYSKGMQSVAKLGFYYPTMDYVLLDGFKRTMGSFFAAVGAEDAQSQEQLLAYMTNPDCQDAFRVSGPNGVLMLARPVHLLSHHVYDGVVFYILDQSNLEGIFRANLPHNATVAALRYDGHWLLNTDDRWKDFMEQNEFQDYLKNHSATLFETEAANGPVQIYKYQDEDTGNIFLTMIAKEEALKAINEYSNRISTIVLSSVIMLGALAGTTIYISYTPLKRLVHKHSPGRSNMSELERLDSAFFARDERILSQRNLLGSMLLGELIYGSRRKAKFLAQELGCDKFQYFAVATVVSRDISVSQAYKISEQLREGLQASEVFTTSMPSRAHVLFLLLGNESIDTALAQADVVLAVREATNCEGEVQVGGVVHCLEDVQKSYYSSFMDYLLEDETESRLMNDAYPAKEIQAFVQCVCVGDREAAQQTLDKIESVFNTRKFRASYGRYYAYKLLTAYLSGVNENAGGIPNEEMDELMAFTDHTELFMLLRKSVIACCDRVALMAEKANLEMQQKLIRYVDDHLTDVDLCLSTTAEQLNMSIYAVSRLFREGTGCGFKEYVVDKRLERAMELLINTDDSVGEIARAIGFENSTYFSTVFKKHYGISPTKVRN